METETFASETSDHEAALSIINELHDQIATLARAVIKALADKKVSPLEGIMLAMKGSSLATYILTMLDGVDLETRADLLYVLEHGRWSMGDQ